tara:strand:- start:5578 stop:6168 length:591 start_codon:yes stop_codon:yes gene_type:complete
MNHFPKIIGVAGVARAGKDTFFKYISECVDVSISRIAFADELKKDLNNFMKAKAGISPFTNVTEEKNIIRPMLVAYGCMMRDISNGRYWVSKIDTLIKQSYDPYFCITDVRFPNEVDYIQKNSGIVVHLSRLDENGKTIPPANEEEEAQDPIIKEKADYCISWNTFDSDDEKYKSFVRGFLATANLPVKSSLDSLA